MQGRGKNSYKDVTEKYYTLDKYIIIKIPL